MATSTRDRSQTRWIREECLAALYFYVTRKDELTSPQNHPFTEKLATAMGRTTDSIGMRIQNYKSLDPEYPGSGLEGVGASCEKIWREYEADPDRVLAEARRAYRKFVCETCDEEE